jgi:ribosomal protein L27
MQSKLSEELHEIIFRRRGTKMLRISNIAELESHNFFGAVTGSAT